MLANARAEVLVEHCRRSNAGLFYADRWEFIEALKLLMREDSLRRAMGANGKDYVNRHYRWSLVIGKYERLFGRLTGQAAAARQEDRERPREFTRERPRGHERGRPGGDRRHRGGDQSRRHPRDSRPRR